MGIFTYFEDHSIRCLVGKLNQTDYIDLVDRRRKLIIDQFHACFEDRPGINDLSNIAFQYLMIANHRRDHWDYPVFCYSLKKSHHTQPSFHVTKGLNKIYANFIARRPTRDLPILVINYGKITDKISIEHEIYDEEELARYLGIDAVFLRTSEIVDGEDKVMVISHIRDDKVSVDKNSYISKWIFFLKSLMTNGKISVMIKDNFSSQIVDSSGIFDIKTFQSDYQVPSPIERTTHIREYKNSLKNNNEKLLDFILVTNRKIKLDLFDTLWFFRDHASDYVSEDRSYSLLGPGNFRADSIVPSSEQ